MPHSARLNTILLGHAVTAAALHNRSCTCCASEPTQEFPGLAGETICQHITRRLGLSAPSENTSAVVTAAVVVAMYGPRTAMVPQMEVDNVYNWTKARPCMCTHQPTYRHMHPMPSLNAAVTTAALYVLMRHAPRHVSHAGPHQNAGEAICIQRAVY